MDPSLELGLVMGGVAVLLLGAGFGIWLAMHVGLIQRRIGFIRGYRFPDPVRHGIAARHPQWQEAQIDRVLEALREFFIACTLPRRRRIAQYVGMPSKAADEAWHDFLALERDYRRFCKQAFGELLRHVPKEAMDEAPAYALANTLQLLRLKPIGLDATAGEFPLLFAIDHELGIGDGHHYEAATLKRLDALAVKLRAARKNLEPASATGMAKPPCAAAATDGGGGGPEFGDGGWVGDGGGDGE